MSIELLTPEFWADVPPYAFVLNRPAFKVAAYANSSGEIALCAVDDEDEIVIALEPDEAVRLASVLLAAIPDAKATAAEISETIERNLGGSQD